MADQAARITLTIALAGFTSFSLLFGAQPLLPQISREFALAPASASLCISMATSAMALLLIPLSLVGERIGRTGLMRGGLLGASACALASALAPQFPLMLLCRLGLGLCIAAVMACALAHLGEEMPPGQRARAIGLYIGANALGGMLGRLMASLAAEWLDWRAGLLAQGLLGAAAALAFCLLLPPARQFRPRSIQPSALLADVRRIYADPALPWLFLTGCLVMGTFVGFFNYLGFRLAGAPYELGPAATGSLFLLYAVGSYASAWAGRRSQQLGSLRLLLAMGAFMLAGLLASLLSPLALILAGAGLFTFGFFAAHAVASAWVGQRAGERRGLVSALYLSSCYLGSSVIGNLSGWPWNWGGWPAVVAALSAGMLLVLVVLARLRRLPAEA